MIDLYGSWISFVVPCHPEANGQVENKNRNFVKILWHLCDHQEKWDEYLPEAFLALRTSKFIVTGFCSFELHYRRKDLYPLSVTLPNLSKKENESDFELNTGSFFKHQKWIKKAIENIKYDHEYWLDHSNPLNKYYINANLETLYLYMI